MRQLLPVLARRGQRRVQGTLETIGAQFPRGDALQPRGVAEAHDVVRPQTHRFGDDGLVDLFADHERRHLRHALRLDLHDRFQIDAQLLDEYDQHLGIQLGERIAQVVSVGQPGAVHGVPGVAQRAVDRFDVILRPRHDDHGYGHVVSHRPKKGLDIV